MVVDAHSTWQEIIGPNALRVTFARFGLPSQVTSDNGPPFPSAEYEYFLNQNGVQRLLVSPYHLSSNGLAERFVQTLKYAMEPSASDPERSMHQRLPNILLVYRSTPQATSSVTPSKLHREVRTKLLLAKPDLAGHVLSQHGKMKQQRDRHVKFRKLNVGDNFRARDHLSSQEWQTGTVLAQTFPHSCQVQFGVGGFRDVTSMICSGTPPVCPLQNQIPGSGLQCTTQHPQEIQTSSQPSQRVQFPVVKLDETQE